MARRRCVLAAARRALLLGDVLGLGQWWRSPSSGGGLLSLVGKGATRASVAWALFTAATIATYTLIDAEGARSSTSAVSYGFALMVFAGAAITVANVVRGRTPDLVAVRSVRALGRGRCRHRRRVHDGARRHHHGASRLRHDAASPRWCSGRWRAWLFLHERMGRRVVSSMIAAGLVLLIALSRLIRQGREPVRPRSRRCRRGRRRHRCCCGCGWCGPPPPARRRVGPHVAGHDVEVRRRRRGHLVAGVRRQVRRGAEAPPPSGSTAAVVPTGTPPATLTTRLAGTDLAAQAAGPSRVGTRRRHRRDRVAGVDV
ncbi:MAG: hypothetical protein R2699_16225 [Acidimicrobiales bacterium]